MNIKIKSEFQFCETLYDVAFGMCKSIILNGKKTAVRRKNGFILTAKKKPNSVVVTIHSCEREAEIKKLATSTK